MIDNLPEAILSLMQKLQAMTVANGCTPAEAANAAERLERLLNSHQLSMADIPAREVGEPLIVLEKEQERYSESLRIPATMIHYATEISTAWRCQLLFSGNVLKFIGFRSDATVAAFFFDTTYWRLRKEALRQGKRLNRRRHLARQFVDNFLCAAGEQIRRRMKQFGGEGDSRALVIIKEQQVDQFIAEKFVVNKRELALPKCDYLAEEAGRKFADEMEIMAGIDKADTAKAAIGAGS